MGHDLHPNDKGIIEEKFHDGKLEKMTALIDFKAFYNELHDALVSNHVVKFHDMMGTKTDKDNGEFFNHQVNDGEHIDNDNPDMPYMNRTGDMFETKFYWVKKDETSTELEVTWEAKAMTLYAQGNGWMEFKLDLVCRHIVDKEVLIGNNKKVMQEGAWEFRNKLVYKNNVVRDFLWKVPVVKNSHMLQGLYLNHMYKKLFEKDVDFCKHKLKPIIYNVIEKHFGIKPE